MSVAFLVVSVAGLVFTLNAHRPFARRGPLSVPCFFAGWLTSELPVHHVLWQVVAAAAFVTAGGLERWPGWVALVLSVASWVGLVALLIEGHRSRAVLEAALAEGLGPGYSALTGSAVPDGHLPLWRLAWPFRRHHPDVRSVRNVAYAPHGRRGLLDVYHHRDRPQNAPVLLQIHGGAWMLGSKDQQGIPLMVHLASRGWVCVAINYRLSPRATFPDHIVDVKRAIAWIRERIGDYGGDPSFVVITGGSAGGHLAALAALTPNHREWQPGFEEIDTSVAACVPFYGVYDFTNTAGVGRADMEGFLTRVVMKSRLSDDRVRWEAASPLHRVNADAPPFFVIHGRNDSLVPVTQARLFVERLRGVSANPVVYAELPGAQHAFDVFFSLRTWHVVRAVERFCVYVRTRSTRGSGHARP
ncbi:MAG: alpha/beta hydrolase [Acidimicrobiia bacterium]